MGPDLHGSGGRLLVSAFPAPPLYGVLRRAVKTPFNDDAARSRAQADAHYEDHFDELTITDSHRDPTGEAVGEAWSSPSSCMSAPHHDQTHVTPQVAPKSRKPRQVRRREDRLAQNDQ
jgi:hypothetical protein